jgi:hypothetical protein
MKISGIYITISLLLLLSAAFHLAHGQTDTASKKPGTANKDSLRANNDTLFIFRQKGLIGKLARNLMVDTGDGGESLRLARNDRIFQQYKGRVIRKITIERRDFGAPVSDTGKTVKTSLTNLANNMHRKSRLWVIRNNLFFREGERMVPFLMADNERHLRDQDYLGDARIMIRAVPGTRDSIDVTVITKDVLSIGGRFSLGSVTRGEMSLRDDNFFGWGDRIEGTMLYDQNRHEKFGHGFQYIRRNIGGSFINATMGYRNFYPALKNDEREETRYYVSFLKPMVHQFIRWTYALEASAHHTSNMYWSDSLYNSDFRYKYNNVDAWASLNLNVKLSDQINPDNRLRTLIGLRVLNRQFDEIPSIHLEQYNYRYANLFAILGSFSIFRQDFYKTQYIYGFGRNEDVPEGIDFTVTGGYTKKQHLVRPYLGFDMQLNYFSDRDDYFNYTLRLGAFGNSQVVEDVNALFNIDFFGHLRRIGRWKQRTFLNASISKQSRTVLNEPLILDSDYGLREIRDGVTAGSFRTTLKAESVFYSNLSLFSFRFATFVFANAAWLRPYEQPWSATRFYNSLGGGLRTRNESLTFGTIEFRAFYFPKKNYGNDYFRFELNTNIRFRYNRQLIKRPEFFRVN